MAKKEWGTLAEREGFEPSATTRAAAVFETAPIGHSGTSPSGWNYGILISFQNKGETPMNYTIQVHPPLIKSVNLPLYQNRLMVNWISQQTDRDSISLRGLFI